MLSSGQRSSTMPGSAPTAPRGAGRDRAAQQDLPFAARRQRLFDILDGTARDPRHAGPADAGAAAEDRRQSDRFGEFEQAAACSRDQSAVMLGSRRSAPIPRRRRSPGRPEQPARTGLRLQRRTGSEGFVADPLPAHAEPDQPVVKRLHERRRAAQVEIEVAERQDLRSTSIVTWPAPSWVLPSWSAASGRL